MVVQPSIKHRKGTGKGKGSGPIVYPKVTGKKAKGPEVVFDELARAEYLTGFRKRKQDRLEAGRAHAIKKAKEEHLAERAEARKARKEQAAENVRNERKAFGLEEQQDVEEEGQEEDASPEPVVEDEEYDSDQHHTHVTVEAFDPEEAAYVQAISVPTRPKTDAPSATTAAAGTSNNTKIEALPPSSRRVNKAKANASLPLPIAAHKVHSTDSTSSSIETGKGKETNHSHQKEDGPSQQQQQEQERRLVVSGFTSAFKQAEISQRFSAFGTVVALDGFGKTDANGDLRPFAYLTLRATEPQIRRCMNMLSGSMWKGAKLRIGEAKPDFEQRWATEQKEEAEKREQEERERRAKLKRKSLPPGKALESPHIADLVTKKHLEKGYAWGWKQSPEGYLVRPLRVRPDHPLPKPQPLAVDPTAQRQKPRRLNSRPPTKAHRVTIDPTRYGAVHLAEEHIPGNGAASISSVDVELLGPGEWQCHEIDDELETDSSSNRLVRWQYTASDGLVLHEEFAKVPVRVVVADPSTVTTHDTQDDALFDNFDRYSAAPSDDLFSDFPVSKASAGARTEVDDLFSDFPVSNKATNNGTRTEVDDLFSDFPATSKLAQRKEVSDLFSEVQPRPAAIVAKKAAVKGTFVAGLDPEEDPAYFSDGYDEALPPSVPVIEEGGERQATLALIAQMFGTETDDASPIAAAPVSSDSDSSASEVEVDPPQQDEVLTPSESNSESEEDDSEAVSSQDSEVVNDVIVDGIEDSAIKAASPVAVVEPSVPVEAVSTQAVQRSPTPQAPAVVEEAVETSAEVPMVQVAAVETKPSRRAAFLFDAVAADSSKTDSRLVPRFDPGPRAPTPPPAAAKSESKGSTVAFSSLKAMFKPQDSSSSETTGFAFSLGATEGATKGFSIMESLGLELELDDLEDPEPIQETVAKMDVSHMHPSRAAILQHPDASHPSDSVAGRTFFLTPTPLPPQHRRSEAEVNENWRKLQNSLTSQIKKRHREALKKRRRRVTSDVTRQQQPTATPRT